MEKPLVNPGFHAMEACKPERRVFPLEGKHMEKGSLLDGNPIKMCCKIVISMWFPLYFPWREIAFSPSVMCDFLPMKCPILSNTKLSLFLIFTTIVLFSNILQCLYSYRATVLIHKHENHNQTNVLFQARTNVKFYNLTTNISCLSLIYGRTWVNTDTSCRTVALREKQLLTDRRARVPPILKSAYLFRKKKWRTVWT